jgi:hypothetical protein
MVSKLIGFWLLAMAFMVVAPAQIVTPPAGGGSGSGCAPVSSPTANLLLMDNGSGCPVDGTSSATIPGLGIVSGPLTLSGNQSAAAWTTNGIRIKGVAGTLTDTSSSGTVAAAYTDVLGGNTIAASSAVTFTNYYTSYIKAPVAGTNVTMTNNYALGVDSLSVNGGALVTGVLQIGTPGSGISVNGTTVFAFGNGTAGSSSGSLQANHFYVGTGGSGQMSSGLFETTNVGLFGFSSSSNATLACDTCLSRDSAGVIDFGTGAQGSTAGRAKAAAYISGGTTFTISGCSATTPTGGASAGSFLSGTTGACTVVITLNGATGITAPNGWTCLASDLTTPANLISQSASSTTTCTVTGTTVTGDKIQFMAMAF